jgi:hypothetical protein
VCFTSFLPAISTDALTKISRTVRSWRLHRRIRFTFAELARMINPIIVAGCSTTESSIAPRCTGSYDASTPTWCNGSAREIQAATRVQEGQGLLGRDHPPVPEPVRPLALRLRLLATGDDRSRVTGDCHARICGSREVRSLPATRPLSRSYPDRHQVGNLGEQPWQVHGAPSSTRGRWRTESAASVDEFPWDASLSMICAKSCASWSRPRARRSLTRFLRCPVCRGGRNQGPDGELRRWSYPICELPDAD